MPNDPSLLWVVRHGSTHGNEEARFSKDSTEMLSAKGKKQCELLQARLKAERRFFAHHFCGLLVRQIESARIIAPDATWQNHFGLNERGVGKWAGRLAKEIEKEQPEDFKLWHQCAYTPPNAEPLYEFRARVQTTMDQVLRPALQDGPVLVITSAMVIAAMLGSPSALGMPPSNWWHAGIKNTSITIFDPNPGTFSVMENAWQVVRMNDLHHLPESCR